MLMKLTPDLPIGILKKRWSEEKYLLRNLDAKFVIRNLERFVVVDILEVFGDAAAHVADR